MTEPIVAKPAEPDYRKMYLDELDRRIQAEQALAVEKERINSAVDLMKLKVINTIVDISV